MENITIKDVARKVGVSASTVSRVMRGKANISPETTKRVLQHVKKMGYFPDSGARAMVKKETKTIGVSVSDISNPFYPPLIRGIENTVNKFAYSIILCNTDEDTKKEEQYLKIMLEKRIDGLIVSPTSPKIPILKMFEIRNIPIVCIDRSLENIEADTVCVDNAHGAFMATEHLIKLGHKRVAIVTGIKGIATTEERLKGYLDALTRYGIEKDLSLIVRGNSTIQGSIEATKSLFKLKSPPTCIFSANNLMLIGTYIALKKLKKRIPEDIAVIGFDDFDWAEALAPTPTVVSQPNYTIGATAAQILMQRILKEGPQTRQNITLKTELIIRQSCGAKCGAK
ncbi:LacI family DNA-binding transcriptional regulator [Candidatus Aerophobetes bacterium]|nr:LacI family DNA-binding transcriptional regulator [Candidatus Aerophobetes bacterium]